MQDNQLEKDCSSKNVKVITKAQLNKGRGKKDKICLTEQKAPQNASSQIPTQPTFEISTNT